MLIIYLFFFRSTVQRCSVRVTLRVFTQKELRGEKIKSICSKKSNQSFMPLEIAFFKLCNKILYIENYESTNGKVSLVERNPPSQQDKLLLWHELNHIPVPPSMFPLPAASLSDYGLGLWNEGSEGAAWHSHGRQPQASLGPALCESLSGTCGCDHRSRNTSMYLF